MKRLVAVSWNMPPIVLPRSIQVARTLKALTGLGWRADVVTVPPEAAVGMTLDSDLSALYAGHYEQHVVEPREAVAPSDWALRMLRLIQCPENVDEDNWIRRGGEVVLRLAGDGKVDALVTFAQPWADHRLGLFVKQQRPDLPWLAHFSDPWTDSPYYNVDTPEAAARMERWRMEERGIIEAADAVVFVTEQTADLVMRKYPPEWRAKVHVVPHGFDRDCLVGPVPEHSPDGPLTLVYTGNIYEGLRDPVTLFEAMKALGGGDRLSGRLAIDFYSNSPEALLARRDALGLHDIVTFNGRVGYLESLRIARAADILLLIEAASDVSVFMPSKLVDYLMLDRPILALTPSTGASAEILGSTGHVVVAPDDVAGIAEALDRLLKRREAGERLEAGPSTVAEAFDITATTRVFERALAAAVARGQTP